MKYILDLCNETRIELFDDEEIASHIGGTTQFPPTPTMRSGQELKQAHDSNHTVRVRVPNPKGGTVPRVVADIRVIQ